MSDKELQAEFQRIGAEKDEKIRARLFMLLNQRASTENITKWICNVLTEKDRSWAIPSLLATLTEDKILSDPIIPQMLRVWLCPLCLYLAQIKPDEEILTNACLLLRKIERSVWTDDDIDNLSKVLQQMIAVNSKVFPFWNRVAAYKSAMAVYYARIAISSASKPKAKHATSLPRKEKRS